MAEEGPKEVKLSENIIQEPEEPVIELGDRIRIYGGKYDKTTGRVIYRTEDELHIIPDGLTNQVKEFRLTEEGFDPESGVESVEILQKRKKADLVEILDLRVGQDLETFKPDGEPLSKYRITKVDPESDLITIENEDEGEIVIPFGFKGVPRDLPFRVIRGRQPLELPTIAEASDDQEEPPSDILEGEDEEEDEDFAFLDDELQAPADEGVEQLIEIPTSERTYSNQTQKSEGYADLLSLNTPAMQKLTETQRATRVLTEVFFQLRASILRTSEDGTPKGVKPSTIQTLVDALETRLLALSRCVVGIDKIIYYDKSAEDETQPDTMDGLRIQSFTDKIRDGNEYIESSPEISSQKFTQFLNSYLSKYAISWKESGGNRVAFQRDEEVFRRSPPEPEANIPGYAAYLPDVKKAYLSSDYVSEVSMSLVRGLKALKVKSQILQLGEEAAVLSYVLFPLAYASSLTTLRHESLVADIQDGQKEIKSMKSILKESGEITDIPSASQPFLVSVDGGTLGNIPLRDYIKSMGLRAEGMGDFWPLQVLMGMRDREWTIDQHETLKEIIKETQNQILNEIISQRDALSQQVAQPPAVQGIQMVSDGTQMIEKLAEEPLLKDLQQTLKDQMPGYANSDVLMVGLILRNHPELTMAQLADQPAALTRSRMRYARDEYLKTLNEIQLKKQRVSFAGEPPEPINCPHVKPLAMIRKVKDDKQRLALMAKFLITFQGHKEDNWVKCNVGDHNLLCMHELLQIYQFLRPGDVAALNKDIQLNFGGGQFQGYYICRNCGQPISELEYDTHLEFDDNGRPMMGRSELVDKDAITQEQIEDVIGPLGDVDDPEEFDNETKKLIYNTAKELADRLFAPLEMSDFILIVNRVYGLFQQIPDRDRYVKIQQAQRKGKTGTVVALSADFDVYINQVLVCATAVHMLILIQSRKPDLVLRGIPVGCKSLGGQPLEPDGGTHGIQCVVSSISSYNKDSPPWSLTQFQKEPDDSVRQKTIMSVFEPLMRASLQDPSILQALSQKREYIRKVLGAAGGQGRPDEELPTNFAPIPYSMNEEDFVEKIIVPEAASVEDRAELWIRQGNMIAKKNKMPMPIVFSESSCCLSPLDKADEFWDTGSAKQSLPPFPKRTGVPAPPRITRAEPTMKPSQISRPLPDAPENSYYQLFLKVCYDGDKKGYSHEFGLTHTCMWCDLKLPKEAALLSDEEGLIAIESQGIEVTKETFEDLLNETHRVNSFKTVFKNEIPGPLDNWISLLEIEPEPAEGYKVVMAKTQNELMKLPVDAKEVEVALALSDFSTLAEEMEKKLKTRMPPTQHELFDRLVRGGAGSVIRFLRSYALVPLSHFISRKLIATKVKDSWKLSSQHKDDIESLLIAHRGYITKFNKVDVTPWLKAKVETLIAQTRSILQHLEILRPLQIPGGIQTYEYFLKFCLYAPLANFVDPNTLPIALDTETPSSQVEQQALFPAKFISDMVNRFKEESLNLTPEQIRELIAKRNEMEKSNILRKMTDMPRAQKDITKIQMKLGIGEWAVGGTKAIYAYDKDRYDIERDQRAQAGIVDFPGYGPEGQGQVQENTDGLGYFQANGDEAGYIDDGELGDINGFDDDN
jgi:ribosomal protein L24